MTEIVEKIKALCKNRADTSLAKKRMAYFKFVEKEDIFLGLTNPAVQKIFSENKNEIHQSALSELFYSEIHEIRYGAICLLIERYEKAKKPFEKQDLFHFLIDHLERINNWDLVDTAAYKVVGHYVFNFNETEILYKLLSEDNIWKKRMVIVACFYEIRQKKINLSIEIIRSQITHKHEMVQKACGWMLREAWARGNSEAVEEFLIDHIKTMSRVCLRTALEKMPNERKKYFLKM
jgi:3-methyladenine DNA glycosylase AlkD